jgi:hypothetical protein
VELRHAEGALSQVSKAVVGVYGSSDFTRSSSQLYCPVYTEDVRNVLHTNEMNCDVGRDPRRLLQGRDETAFELLTYAFTHVSFNRPLDYG